VDFDCSKMLHGDRERDWRKVHSCAQHVVTARGWSSFQNAVRFDIHPRKTPKSYNPSLKPRLIFTDRSLMFCGFAESRDDKGRVEHPRSQWTWSNRWDHLSCHGI
jgi:hypothetical protein